MANKDSIWNNPVFADIHITECPTKWEDPVFGNSQGPSNGVYIVKCDKYYKIGITERIDNRMIGFKTENPFPVELIFYTKIDYARDFEIVLHEELKEFRHHGEWFVLSENTVKLIISKIIEKSKSNSLHL